MLICLSDFINKKKTNFSINQIDMNYEKPKQKKKQKIIIKFKTKTYFNITNNHS